MTGMNTEQDPFLTRNDLDRWAAHYAAHTAAREERLSPWLVFLLGDERFAVPLGRLSEVSRVARGAALPHASPAILGLINNRGEAVLLVDMGQLLGARGACAQAPDQRVLLFEDENGLRTGFLVDRVLEVASLSEESFRGYGGDQPGDATRFVGAVGEHRGRGLASIDVDALLAAVR